MKTRPNGMNDEARMTNDGKPFLPRARADGVTLTKIRHSEFVIPLMLWVCAGFLLLALAWTVLFTVAHSTKVESVPLTTKGGGTR